MTDLPARSPLLKRACTNCREQKVRCDVVTEPPKPCSRCRRLDLDCTLAPLKRKLRGVHPLGSEVISRPLRHDDASSLLPDPTAGAVSTLPATQNWTAEVPAAPLPHASGQSLDDNGNFQRSAVSHVPASRTIEGVVLSGPIVKRLHRIFFSEYSSCVPILDPNRSPDEYYTLSPLLFWTIMTVALRRYDRDPSLLRDVSQRTTRLALTSVGAAPANVHVVESLLILMTWWLPNNESLQELPFVLAGSLVHLAMHLGLHRPLRSQDFSRIKLYLTEQDLIRRSELWTHTVILYQKFCIINGNFFYSTQDFSRGQREANHLWTSLSADLRYSSRLSNTTANNLVTLAIQGQAADTTSDVSLIGPLIKLADTQLSVHRPDGGIKGASKQLHWQISRLLVYSHHLHENPSIPTSTTLDLYAIACSVIQTLQTLETSTPFFLSTITTYMFQSTCIAIFTILKLLKHPSFAVLVHVPTGEALFGWAVKFLSSLSIVDKDLPNKVKFVTSQLWTSQRAFRNPQGEVPLGLRIRTRGPVSVVYDCVWWWREEFGGQPNTYSSSNTPDARTTTPSNADIPQPSSKHTKTQTNRPPNPPSAVPSTSSHQPSTFPPYQQQQQQQQGPQSSNNLAIPSPFPSQTSLIQPLPPSSSFTPQSSTTIPSSIADNMTDWGDQMLVDLGWDIFDDFLFLDQISSQAQGNNSQGRL